MAENRVPQIIEAELFQGKTKTQIAEDLGVNRSTIYRDRQTPLYDRIKDEFLELYIEKMKGFANSERDNIALQATIELGRMLKAGIVKQTHQRTESAEIKIHLHEFKKNVEATQIEKED